MARSPKEDVLAVVASWLDSAAEPSSKDLELVITKTSYIKDKETKSLLGVRFALRSTIQAVEIDIPYELIETPKLITP